RRVSRQNSRVGSTRRQRMASPRRSWARPRQQTSRPRRPRISVGVPNAGPIVEAAPAKLNLALHVTGRRADGYHSLEMLVAFAEVGDELEAVPANKDSLSVTGPFAKALIGADGNLVLRALAAFRNRWPDALPPGVALTLRKNLPIAAGLGG